MRIRFNHDVIHTGTIDMQSFGSPIALFALDQLNRNYWNHFSPDPFKQMQLDQPFRLSIEPAPQAHFSKSDKASNKWITTIQVDRYHVEL